jgi:uncharacterized protein
LLDFFLLFTLGFLGSFGHCVSMCGPLTAAFSLSQRSAQGRSLLWQNLRFHGLLNLGRILSYTFVGAGIGGLGSVLVASGQMAGIGSSLRQIMATVTGLLLVGFGLVQIRPAGLPKLPILHPLTMLHERLSRVMVDWSMRSHWYTPFLLGTAWGLIPCGFLYTAQIKAATAGSAIAGALSLLAFGCGTFPIMLGVGASTAWISRDRRSQLFRLGGWVTLTIGILTILRTGNMTDYTGHAALVGLMLALIARPISRVWHGLLNYRRVLGVGAFVLAIAHTLHMVEHAWNWNLAAIAFMLPKHQLAIFAGLLSLLLLVPLACTSIDSVQKRMGQVWRSLHLLSIPAFILAVVHCLWIGSSYLGNLQLTDWHRGMSLGLVAIACLTLLIRFRWFWSILSLQQFYVAPHSRAGDRSRII